MGFRERPRIVVATLVAVVCAWAAAGAVRIDVLSSAKDAAPGEVVTHVFAVSDDGAASETLALTVDSPPGWTVLGVPPEITVAPGEEGVVFVTLPVPPDAAAGSFILTLRATATRVAVVNQVELTPPDAQSLSPGGSASYSVIVTNRGNAQDVIAVAATSSRGYAADVSVASLELSPRESREVVVVLDVPADAGPGRDVLTVRATSTLYAGVDDETAIFTTILPPGPDAVGGSLYEVLPTRIAVEIERNETTGAFDSQVSLSMSGAVFDGTFAASATALHPFGSGPVDVTAYSLSYRLDLASFGIGNVSQTLTDLQSISCDGGSTSIDAPFIDVALIAGGSGDETRFGGRLALGPEEAQLGLAYSERRSEASRSAAWTGLACVEPIDGWTLRAEGGLGTVDGKLGRAGFFGTAIEGESYFLSASAFSVDTYFPGPRNDSAGVEASQRLRLAALSLGLSFRHTWNNVVRDPLAPTLVTDSLGVNVSAAPWEEGPTLQGTITFVRNHQADGIPRDDVHALLAYSVADAEGAFPYALKGRIADRLDLLLATQERTLTHTQEVGLSIDGLTVLLRLNEEQVVDLAHDLVLSSAGSATLVVRPGGTPHEASIEFRSVGDQLDLTLSSVLHATEDLSFSLGGFAEWERGNPSAAAFGWSIKVDTTFGVPLPFLVTKGRSAGHVFVDRNANGVFDEEEPLAANAVVFVEESEV
ncbi:MAG: NEW3 domain-containing protein, partial [Candidatus Bipolaricaulota bacterium]|nr:NEW3 domain-containing protein [Candidatus Bipolaricaulota bacterium]